MSPESSPATCTYFDVCGLRPMGEQDGTPYCILHLPTGIKNYELFLKTLQESHIRPGRSDYSFVVWPEGHQPQSFARQHFNDHVTFEGARFRGELNFEDSVFERDLTIKLETLLSLNLSRATIKGNLLVDVRNEVRIIAAEMPQAHGDIIIAAPSVYVELNGSHFSGHLSITAKTILHLSITGCVFDNGMHLRGRIQSRDLRAASACGTFDLCECSFQDRLDLSAVNLRNVLLDLSRTRIEGDLVLTGSSPPSEVRCNGMVVTGATTLEGPLGESRLQVTAEYARPVLGKATFTRVNLSKCRLVGNVWNNIELWDVEWPRQRSRWLLLDEIVLETNQRHLITPLRVAYQLLKERYRTLGDHVRSGDFHYGEMEMKLKEAGRRRFLSPEYWYGLASGYGTRWLRALSVLIFLILAFAALFRWTDSAWFDSDYLSALRFSLAVVTLQRPEIPRWFSTSGRWAVAAESVLGPIQIALLVLALRMRVKR